MQRESPTLESEDLLQLGKDVLSLHVEPHLCTAIVECISSRMQGSHPFYRAAARALRQV